MVEVTKLNNSRVIVNADLIEFVERTPDTLITLTTGRKFMVKETPQQVLELVLAYRHKTRAYPVPMAGASASESGCTDAGADTWRGNRESR